MRIGITVPGAVADVRAALWSSGVLQNVVFLYRLFERLAEVESVTLVACPGGAAGNALVAAKRLAAIDLPQAVEELDVIVELGSRGDPALVARFRERGGKLVSYMAGNVLAMNFEAVACGVPHGELLGGAGYDATWITPQHWRMNASYARLTRSSTVECVPHLWSPELLLDSAAEAGATLFRKTRAAGAPVRIGVLDPNVNVLKTFHWPLLVCEHAYRRRPEAIDRVLLFSADHLKGNMHFEEFCASTDLGRDGRLFAETRFPLAQLLGSHIDMVVTHQWENALNYLYWDVLYAGYPLVHNSEAVEAGFHYPSFDPESGAEALLAACADGTEAREARERTEAALWLRHVDNAAVQRRHSELLGKLTG